MRKVGRPKNPEAQTGVTVLVSDSMLARLDSIKNSMRWEFEGLTVSRASIIRSILARWLKEQESKTEPRKRTRST